MNETFLEGCRLHLEALAALLRGLDDTDAQASRSQAGEVLEHLVSARILASADLHFAPLKADIGALDGCQASIRQVQAFLDRYAYTIDESGAADLGCISPACLSQIHELSLGLNNALGAYYTPDAVVRIMCRESLSDYLSACLDVEEAQAVRAYVADLNEAHLAPFEGLREVLCRRLFGIRICDPAVGSGEFPIGLMHEFSRILLHLDPDRDEASARRHYFEHVIFGVDIDRDAVEIARFRAICAIASAGQVPDCLRIAFVHGDSLSSDGPLAVPELTPGAFDLVIGNPPYGVKLTRAERVSYRARFPWLHKRFDIYLAFFSLGMWLTRGSLCFITPDKWLTKSFGLLFREHVMVPHMYRIVRFGSAVFGSALVDAVVSCFSYDETWNLDVMRYADGGCTEPVRVDKRKLVSPWLIDQYFNTEQLHFIESFERQPRRLGAYATCEYAFASAADAYKLEPLIVPYAPDSGCLKLLNTGLIGKYIPRWGQVEMRYLHHRYVSPAVRVADIQAVFGASVLRRMQSPKLIIKGLSLLDCTLDLLGCYASTVATLYVRAEDPRLLMVLAALINHPDMQAYLRAKYASSSFCGGLLFTPDMLASLPVPDLGDLSVWQDVIDAVEGVLGTQAVSQAQCLEIDRLVALHYGI